MSSTGARSAIWAVRRPADRRRQLLAACTVWLVIASACTVIGLTERWPAQFGGDGESSKIATQWMTKGTVLSPPLFMLFAMAVAVALVMAGSRSWVRALGACLAIVAGAVGVVGSLGEVAAAATPRSRAQPRIAACSAPSSRWPSWPPGLSSCGRRRRAGPGLLTPLAGRRAVSRTAPGAQQ